MNFQISSFSLPISTLRTGRAGLLALPVDEAAEVRGGRRWRRRLPWSAGALLLVLLLLQQRLLREKARKRRRRRRRLLLLLLLVRRLLLRLLLQLVEGREGAEATRESVVLHAEGRKEGGKGRRKREERKKREREVFSLFSCSQTLPHVPQPLLLPRLSRPLSLSPSLSLSLLLSLYPSLSHPLPLKSASTQKAKAPCPQTPGPRSSPPKNSPPPPPPPILSRTRCSRSIKSRAIPSTRSSAAAHTVWSSGRRTRPPALCAR